MGDRSPRRSSCSASSTRRRGRISTSPAPASPRRRTRSTRAGAPAGACGCSTTWWRSTTKSSPHGPEMTEVLFYHLQHQPLERALPALLEKSLERGWRAIVQAGSEERIEALDAHLWTFRDDSFLPHGTWRESEAAAQPILLTVSEGNPN